MARSDENFRVEPNLIELASDDSHEVATAFVGRYEPGAKSVERQSDFVRPHRLARSSRTARWPLTPMGVAHMIKPTRDGSEGSSRKCGPEQGGLSMSAQTNDLFVLEDLEDARKTDKVPERDLTAAHTEADWIKTFVARPNKDLGRDGPVCPFIGRGLERKTVWLALEQVADRSVLDLVDLINSYKRVLLRSQPIDGDGATYKAIVVLFTDLSPDRAKDVLDDLLQHVAVSSYVEDGLALGTSYKGNEVPAIHSPSFRPFTSPVPFLLMRPAVISDWKFFLDDEDWLNRWARRYGEAAVQALAEELRSLPWRARHD
jgi:hypothetical protein